MVPTSNRPVPTAPTAAKSMLARLLATENISVQHQNIPTAFFDLKTRSLHLPLWSNASGSLYDMLVGHEVAHALFTPVPRVHRRTLQSSTSILLRTLVLSA